MFSPIKLKFNGNDKRDNIGHDASSKVVNVDSWFLGRKADLCLLISLV